MSNGFLDMGELNNVQTSGLTGCRACKMNYDCDNPEMQPLVIRKSGDKKILFVIENPSATDDEKGKLLSGDSGKYLIDKLKNIIPENYALVVTSAIKCSGSYKDDNIQHCNIKLLETIQNYKPDLIIASGTASAKSLLKNKVSGRLKGIEFNSYFGEQIPFGNYFIGFTWDFRHVFTQLEKDVNFEKMFITDIKNALSCINKNPEIKPAPENKIKILTEVSEIIPAIKEKIKSDICTFDYETTGIKPQGKEHEIKIMSIADKNDSIVFPTLPEVIPTIQEFLKSDVKKIAHNLNFEDVWSYFKFNISVENWYWDTLLSAHCLHNNKPCGLKFLIFSKLGIIYDSKVDEFLKSNSDDEDKKGANAVNRIMQAPLKDVLYYCGLDSYYTFLLYEYQKKQFEKLPEKLSRGRDFFLEGQIALSHVNRNGIKIDIEKMETTKNELSEKIDVLFKKIMGASEVKKWRGKDRFNPDSNQQLGKLLYNILKYPKPKSIPPTDEQALQLINLSFCSNILQYRKLKKLRDTYIAQFDREVCEGYIYPFFNLHRVATFRSSSSAPNFQNIPKRDKQAFNTIRSLIIPREGHKLIEYDYKALEVSIAGCVFKDPAWLKYCRDFTKDMHRDVAQEILYFSPTEWEKLPDSLKKVCRQSAKNGYVFPSVYGSTGQSASEGMWKQLPPEIKLHLKKHKIKNQEDLTKRMIAYDTEYWEKRYPVYGKKRKLFYKKYLKTGYIDQVSGFRCQAPLRYTQTVNYPVQGPASHIKLRALCTIQDYLEKNNMRTKLLGEIHDAIIFDCHPDEEKKLDKIVQYYATKEVTKFFDWIIVPLVADKESAGINESWANCK